MLQLLLWFKYFLKYLNCWKEIKKTDRAANHAMMFILALWGHLIKNIHSLFLLSPKSGWGRANTCVRSEGDKSVTSALVAISTLTFKDYLTVKVFGKAWWKWKAACEVAWWSWSTLTCERRGAPGFELAAGWPTDGFMVRSLSSW